VATSSSRAPILARAGAHGAAHAPLAGRRYAFVPSSSFRIVVSMCQTSGAVPPVYALASRPVLRSSSIAAPNWRHRSPRVSCSLADGLGPPRRAAAKGQEDDAPSDPVKLRVVVSSLTRGTLLADTLEAAPIAKAGIQRMADFSMCLGQRPGQRFAGEEVYDGQGW